MVKLNNDANLKLGSSQKRRLTLTIGRGAENSPSPPEGCACGCCYEFALLDGCCLPRPNVNPPPPPPVAPIPPVLLVYIGGFALPKNGFVLVAPIFVLLFAPLLMNGLVDELLAGGGGGSGAAKLLPLPMFVF